MLRAWLAEEQRFAEQAEESLDAIRNEFGEDEPGCSDSATTDESLEQESFIDESSQSLICENGARVIQSWFREIYSTNAAALVITRFARQYVAMKRAKSYLQKLKHKSMAATTIQCRIRAIGANLKFKLIDQQLQSSLQAVEEEFNEKWKLSLIEQILNRAPEQENKIQHPPAIKSSWLRMIPRSAHPPFEVTNAE
jgi:hypothetical protein